MGMLPYIHPVPTDPPADWRATNAVTHGLTGAVVLESERKAYDSARSELVAAYSPGNALEQALVDRLAHLVVRSQRAGDLEQRAFAECCGEGGEVNWALFERMTLTVGRYDLAIGRALAKAKHELERVTRERDGEQTVAPAVVDLNW